MTTCRLSCIPGKFIHFWIAEEKRRRKDYFSAVVQRWVAGTGNKDRDEGWIGTAGRSGTEPAPKGG